MGIIKNKCDAKDVCLMYHKSDYKSQKLTFITYSRWLPWRKKEVKLDRQKSWAK